MEVGTPQRKSLMILSSAIIVLELAGGKFEGASTPFGALTLTRPEILLYLLWLVFCFSVFRYWQSIGSPSYRQFSINYKVKLDEAIHHTNEFKNMAQAVLPDDLILGKNVPDPPLIVRGIFTRYVDYMHSIRDRQGTDISYREGHPTIKFPLKAFLALELRAHWKIMFTDSWWFNEIFPWFMILIALTLILINHAI